MTTATTPAEQIVEWLGILTEPDSVVELRVLYADETVVSRLYEASDHEFKRLVKTALRLGADAKGTYVSLNPLRSDCSFKSAGDKHVARRRWLFIDIDPTRPADISSSHSEKENARLLMTEIVTYLAECGWPEPIFADSGNGYHALYRIDLPSDDGGLVKRCLSALAKRFNSDNATVDKAVFNAARIVRLYGSTARKGAATAERPHRVSAIVAIPATINVVPVELLQQLADEIEVEKIPTVETATGVLPRSGEFMQPSSDDQRPGDDYGQRGDVRALLRRHGWKPCPQTDEHEYWCRPGKEHGNSASLIDGKVLHVFSSSTCFEAGESYSPFAVFAMLEHGGDFAAASAELRRQGFGGDDDQWLNQVDLSGLLANLGAAIEARKTPPNRPFKAWTMAELDAAEFPLNYLIENVLVAGQPCVIAAAKKSLKTNVGCDLMLSLASGSKFLGEFWVPEAVRVALMTGESGDATIQETLRRIARSKPWVSLAKYENAICSFDLPRLGQPQTKAELTSFITDNDLKVLIIDPAYLCLDLGDDAGNLFSVGKKLRELTDIGHETNCTIAIIHHNKKSTVDPFAIPELESIAWSGFQEWARQWLLIGRRERYDAENAGSHRMWLNVGGSAGHSGCWSVDIEEGRRSDPHGRRWDVTVGKASEAIAETIQEREAVQMARTDQKVARKIAADAEKLLAQYRKVAGGDTPKAIREVVGLSGTRFSPANQQLLDNGLIEPCRIKKHTREEPAYRLKTDAGTGGTGGTNPGSPGMFCGGGTNPLKGGPTSTPHTSCTQIAGGGTEISPGIDPELANRLFP